MMNLTNVLYVVGDFYFICMVVVHALVIAEEIRFTPPLSKWLDYILVSLFSPYYIYRYIEFEIIKRNMLK